MDFLRGLFDAFEVFFCGDRLVALVALVVFVRRVTVFPVFFVAAFFALVLRVPAFVVFLVVVLRLVAVDF